MIGLLVFATIATVDAESRVNRYAECIDAAMGTPKVREMSPQALAGKAENACQLERLSLLSIKGARSGTAERLHDAALLLAAHKLSGKGDRPLPFSEVEEMMRANAQHQ